MALARRSFIKNMGMGLAAAHTAARSVAALSATETSGSAALLRPDPRQPQAAPKGTDRLPLLWYQKATHRLKEQAADRGVEAILLHQDANMVYYSGCFRGSGERSTWVLFPVAEKDTIYWYSPGIDRDLIGSWWSTENDYYFCYPHAEGGFPNRGQVARGKRVDLWEWLLEGLKKRRLGEKTIGIDKQLSASQKETAARVLPKAKFVEIGDICLQMRIIKSPEEIALLQRAYRYFDQVHAFARDYILERGTETTDFEIGQALQAYGIGLMMKDVNYDGKPHTAVAMEVSSNYVRTGVSTAYPHPNQFFYRKVQRGDALYVNTDIRLGGYGGECYRNYQIAPWSLQQEKMWQVVADSVEIQQEESKPGVRCAEVAEKIHRHQVKNGMAEYIYHRPAHGSGQNYEGHQPPYISLGDDTLLEEGMVFSMEPGLYDPARGFGINPSDCLLITKESSVRLSRVPFSREWSFLRL